MLYYRWNHDKSLELKSERGISFEQVVMHIEKGDLLDILQHPNQSKYPNQLTLVVAINDDAYLVPFIQDEEGIFLKTIIPSRKATKNYLGASK
jgi:uncharacterized DUF497 family protein